MPHPTAPRVGPLPREAGPPWELDLLKAPKRHIKERHTKEFSWDPGSTEKPTEIHRKSVVGGGPAAGNRR